MNAATMVSHKLTDVLMLCLACAYSPHLLSSPIWLSGLIIIILLLRLCVRKPLPASLWRKLRISFFLIGMAGLAYTLRTRSQGEFFIALFVLATFLKTLEIRSIRDCKELAISNLYLIFTSLLLYQELWIVPWLLTCVIAQLSVFLAITSPEASLLQLSKVSMRSLWWSLPLAIFLFYYFPRVSQPLWHVPSIHQGAIGFGDELELGKFPSLFYNEETALRITLHKTSYSNRYWRGAILNRFDGKRWKTTRVSPSTYHLLPKVQGEQPHYEILMEPTYRKWIFYTNQAQAASPSMLFSPNSGLVRSNQAAIEQRFRYQISSQPRSDATISPNVRQQNLRYPKWANRQLIRWAQDLAKTQQYNTSKIINYLQHHIRKQPFWYTLQPSDIGYDYQQLDRFWFDTKNGYCEHYASAIALILRASGIPARIIVGYHGGRWNPIGQYVEIQQADAHAWLEYWQDNVGWQRLDPVQFINPARIEPSIAEHYQRTAYSFRGKGVPWSWWQHSIHFWESGRYFWERWVLFYNQESQRRLLAGLGWNQGTFQQLLQICIIGGLLFVLMYFVYMPWRKQRHDQSKLQKEYRRWRTFLQRSGIIIHPTESLYSQCEKISDTFPTRREAIMRYYQLYESTRYRSERKLTKYGDKALAFHLKRLRKLLRH